MNDRPDAPALDNAAQTPNELQQLAHQLSYQCLDGSLVRHPRDCGKERNLQDILPDLQIG